MTPYEALYGRKCRTPVCWTYLNEHKVIGPNIVKETEEKVRVIQQRLKDVNDRQNSYADLKRKDIEKSEIRFFGRYHRGGRYSGLERKGNRVQGLSDLMGS